MEKLYRLVIKMDYLADSTEEEEQSSAPSRWQLAADLLMPIESVIDYNAQVFALDDGRIDD